MSKGIMQQQKCCYLCGAQTGLEEHHVFGGVANRKISEKYGLKVWLCHEHHTGKDGAQYNRNVNQGLKRLAQIAFEARHSHDEWMQVIRKNYL
jgi:hypothetical protein